MTRWFWRFVGGRAEVWEYRLGGLVEFAHERTGDPSTPVTPLLYQYDPSGESSSWTWSS